MKLLYLIIFFTFTICSAQKKLQIETIMSQPTRVTSQDAETGRVFYRSMNVPKTKRLDPMILIKTKYDNKLTFLLQGNISSGGLSINKVKNMRLEKGEQIGDTINLKYYVEIANIAGKEGNNINGYNYKKVEKYKIPKNIKTIKVELYEDRISQRTGSKFPKLKLVAEEIFNVDTTI